MKKKFSLMLKYGDDSQKVFDLAGGEFNIFDNPVPTGVAGAILQRAFVPFMVAKSDAPLTLKKTNIDAQFLDYVWLDFECEDDFGIDIRAAKKYYNEIGLQATFLELVKPFYEVTDLNKNKLYRVPAGGAAFSSLMRKCCNEWAADWWDDILCYNHNSNPACLSDYHKRYYIFDQWNYVRKRTLCYQMQSPRIVLRRKKSVQPTE